MTWRLINITLAVLAALAGCNLIFPYAATPGQADGRYTDAATPDGKLRDAGKEDTASPPQDGRGDKLDGQSADTVDADRSGDVRDVGGVGDGFADGKVLKDGLATPDGCQGCMDENGVCQPGTSMDACGTGGGPCVKCDPLAVCEWWGCSTE